MGTLPHGEHLADVPRDCARLLQGTFDAVKSRLLGVNLCVGAICFILEQGNYTLEKCFDLDAERAYRIVQTTAILAMSPVWC